MDTPRVSLSDLKTISTFSDLSEEALVWLQQHGELIELAAGEPLFSRGEEANQMFALLSGKVQVMADLDGKGLMRPVFSIETGQISGYLPYSRMQKAFGSGIAAEPTRAFSVHKDRFKEMAYAHPGIIQRLVALMTDRVRMTSRQEQTQVKLAALGKLSAGLAHELNNPAASIRRNAQNLRERIKDMPKRIEQLLEAPPSPEKMQRLMAMFKGRSLQGHAMMLSVLERNEQVDELAIWLEDHGLEDGFHMAESFLDMGFKVDDLEQIPEIFPDETLTNVLNWLDGTLTVTRLADEIEVAADRITSLVESIKSYSHMDRATDMQKTDLQEGIKSTLTMLGHKIKAKNIQVRLHFQENLPPVKAFVSELNQVWTNLIDNAIDASPEGGQLEIETRIVDDFVQVLIIDNGPGIPEDIQVRIFEPFYTTKSQGEGTGLGLDIVRRIIENHNGDIQLSSHPGRTEFLACFPTMH